VEQAHQIPEQRRGFVLEDGQFHRPSFYAAGSRGAQGCLRRSARVALET
jgi:hypothetical protein